MSEHPVQRNEYKIFLSCEDDIKVEDDRIEKKLKDFLLKTENREIYIKCVKKRENIKLAMQDMEDVNENCVYVINTHRDLDNTAYWQLGYAMGRKIKIIGYYKGEKYLFSWDNIPGNDDEKLRKFLVEDIGIDWAEDAKIDKSNDGTTISIYKDEKNSAKIIMGVNKEKAILKISDGRTRDLKVKTDNNKLNLYEENKKKIRGDVNTLTNQYHSDNSIHFLELISHHITKTIGALFEDWDKLYDASKKEPEAT